MSQQAAFDQLTEELSGIIAKELQEMRAEMKALREEHAAKLGELRGLREQYRRQMLTAVRAEVCAARADDRQRISDLEAEVELLRRQVTANARSEYAR